jgi:hypothetical protein
MDLTLFSSLLIVDTSQDKENKYCIEYVDVKSEGLQDILHEIFKNVNEVSLEEDKLSVSRIFTLKEAGHFPFILTLALGPSSSLAHLSTSVRGIPGHS